MLSKDDNKETKAEATEGEVTPAETETSKEESERTFSQRELDKIVKREVAKAARKAKQSILSKLDADKESTTKQPPPADTTELSALAAKLERLEKRDQWNRIALEKGLTFAQAETVFDLFLIKDPEDASAWTDEVITAMGIKAKPEETAKEPVSQAPAHVQAQAPPFTPGAASSAPREPSLDPRKWSRDDIERLRGIVESNGRTKFLNDVDRWLDTLDSGPGLFRKKIPKG